MCTSKLRWEKNVAFNPGVTVMSLEGQCDMMLPSGTNKIRSIFATTFAYSFRIGCPSTKTRVAIPSGTTKAVDIVHEMNNSGKLVLSLSQA